MTTFERSRFAGEATGARQGAVPTGGPEDRGRRVALLTAAAALLGGCAGGRSPFGGRTPTAAPGLASQPAGDAAAPAPPDGTMLVTSVHVASADRGRQGVILRAEGIGATLGFHSAELRPVARGADGIEVVELRAWPPFGPQPVGPVRSRLLTAARFYPRRELAGIRGFRVVAAENAVTAPLP